MGYVGVDGCHRGWFYVVLDGPGAWRFDVVSDFEELWRQCSQENLILVDIPIGLREEGRDERQCDVEARRVLGFPRRCSVFPPPCRPALRARSHAEACKINRQHTERGLSLQTWAIAPKIREVDALLRRDTSATTIVREIHPEVLFWALNSGCAMPHKKKTQAGYDERLAVLAQHFSDAQAVVNDALGQFRRKEVARDDILDALAAAVTGLNVEGRLRTLPDLPETDAAGLPMQMVYWCACRRFALPAHSR